MGGGGGGGWVGKLITLSLPTRVEVELGCDNINGNEGVKRNHWTQGTRKKEILKGKNF